MRIVLHSHFSMLCLGFGTAGIAQTSPPLPDSLTLEQCIDYALKNQPYVQQAGMTGIASAYQNQSFRWYPQLSATGIISTSQVPGNHLAKLTDLRTHSDLRMV